jgi:two-component system, cell cycle sensor histidine kinase and response regulator CckA
MRCISFVRPGASVRCAEGPCSLRQVAAPPSSHDRHPAESPVLPQVGERPADVDRAVVPAPDAGGSETILLVEDEDALRELAAEVLLTAGYNVLAARNGQEALTLAEQHPGRIDLLLADVVMPHMGGRELAERLKPLRPEARVLFVSGYTDDAVLRHGVFQDEVHFLQKPFSPQDLESKVREVLGPGGMGAHHQTRPAEPS